MLFPFTCLPRFEYLPRALWHSVAVFYSSPSDKTVLQRLYGQLLSLTLGPRCWFNGAKNFIKSHQTFSYFCILRKICFQTIFILIFPKVQINLIQIYNKFIRCLHQFISWIFSSNFSQFEQLKKKRNFLFVQNSLLFLSLPVEKETKIHIRLKNRMSSRNLRLVIALGETIIDLFMLSCDFHTWT